MNVKCTNIKQVHTSMLDIQFDPNLKCTSNLVWYKEQSETSWKTMIVDTDTLLVLIQQFGCKVVPDIQLGKLKDDYPQGCPAAQDYTTYYDPQTVHVNYYGERVSIPLELHKQEKPKLQPSSLVELRKPCSAIFDSALAFPPPQHVNQPVKQELHVASALRNPIQELPVAPALPTLPVHECHFYMDSFMKHQHKLLPTIVSIQSYHQWHYHNTPESQAKPVFKCWRKNKRLIH